jgi:uncharacterized protein (TIGR03437 family)
MAIAYHEDGSTPITAQSPARPNEVITFYCTGLGAVTPALSTGQPAEVNRAVTRVAVAIGTLFADTLYAGTTPRLVGVYQINARVPAGIQTNLATDVQIGIRRVTIPVQR